MIHLPDVPFLNSVLPDIYLYQMFHTWICNFLDDHLQIVAHSEPALPDDPFALIQMFHLILHFLMIHLHQMFHLQLLLELPHFLMTISLILHLDQYFLDSLVPCDVPLWILHFLMIHLQIQMFHLNLQLPDDPFAPDVLPLESCTS
jgi:hypothetical protein